MFVLFLHLAPSTLASRILPSWQDTGKPFFRYLKSKCLYSVFSQQTAEPGFPNLNLISMLSDSTQSFQLVFFNLPMYYEHTAKFYIRASNYFFLTFPFIMNIQPSFTPKARLYYGRHRSKTRTKYFGGN